MAQPIFGKCCRKAKKKRFAVKFWLEFQKVLWVMSYELIMKTEKLNNDNGWATGFQRRLQTWNWPAICTCLRYFDSLREVGFGKMAKTVLDFVEYLITYFKPSSKYFSKEKILVEPRENSEKNSADTGSKIEAGSLLFKFLASNYKQNESRVSGTRTDFFGSATREEEIDSFSEKAKNLFSDIAGEIASSSSEHSRSVFTSANLAKSFSQLYFVFLGALPSHNRRTVLDKFGLIDIFVSTLLSGENEILCKTILICMPYRGDQGTNECSQLLEISIMVSATKQLRIFALRFLELLSHFWLRANEQLPWSEYGKKEFPWIVNMLLESVKSDDCDIRLVCFIYFFQLREQRDLFDLFSREQLY